MTRKKKEEPAVAATPASDRVMIPTDLIRDNPWNGHRKADDDLIASVKGSGVLQNLVVRPERDPDWPGFFQVISGSRRLDAASKSGIREVPCLVMYLDDRQAREITIVENLQRENLHPVDEAKAIAMLISDGHSTEEVSARIGKTPAFVTRRVKLAGLSERIIEQAGEDLRRMSIRALELLATLPEEKQNDLFDGWGGVTLDAENVARQIANESHAIVGAAFDCADETLVPEAGACMNCPKRTGFEPLLFDDLSEVAQEDSCLDLACYNRKHEAHLARAEAKAREKHGEAMILITSGRPYGSEAAELRKRGVQELAGDWQETGLKRCKKSEKGAKPAFIVHGKGQGTTAWVRDVQTATAAEGDSSGAGEPETPADPMERKRDKLDQRRYAFIAAKLTGMVGGEDEEGNRRLPAEKYCNSEQMVRIAAAFGGGSSLAPPGEDHQVGYDDLAVWTLADKAPAEFHWQRIWDAAGGSLRKAMQVFKVGDIDHDFVDGLKIVADLVGVSWHGLWAEACEAIPEPKAWSRA